VKVLAARADGGDLRAMVDDLRQKLRSGIVLLAAEEEGRVTLALGVTPDLVGRFKAGVLIRGGHGRGGKGAARRAQARARRHEDPEAFDKLMSWSARGAHEWLRHADPYHPSRRSTREVRGTWHRRAEPDPRSVDDDHGHPGHEGSVDQTSARRRLRDRDSPRRRSAMPRICARSRRSWPDAAYASRWWPTSTSRRTRR
jgi:hypothetical protein